MDSQEVAVECFSGVTYADRPLSFVKGNVRYRVSEVVRRWREPGKSCFRVLTEQGLVCDLTYDEQSGKWFLEWRRVADGGSPAG